MTHKRAFGRFDLQDAGVKGMIEEVFSIELPVGERLVIN